MHVDLVRVDLAKVDLACTNPTVISRYLQRHHSIDVACIIRKSWPSDQSDSIPDIPGKILLPGPRKSTKGSGPVSSTAIWST